MVYGYRGAYSNEVRISKDMTGYLIDQTCRFPQPPTSLMCLMYENFSEVLWEVASGNVPTVKYKESHGVQLIIKSDLAKMEEPVAVQFPYEYVDNIDIKSLVVDDNGTWYFNPSNYDMKEIGSISATGKSMKDALNKATKIAKLVKGFDIKVNTDCIEDAEKQIADLHKNGINYL